MIWILIYLFQDSTFRHIMHVLYNVNHDAGDIYGEMESNVLFDIKMITTDKHNRWNNLCPVFACNRYKQTLFLGTENDCSYQRRLQVPV